MTVREKEVLNIFHKEMNKRFPALDITKRELLPIIKKYYPKLRHHKLSKQYADIALRVKLELRKEVA